MTRKARVMAENAADAAIRRHGLNKAYGATPDRDMLIKAALPICEATIKAEEIVDAAIEMFERAKVILDRAALIDSAALDKVEVVRPFRSRTLGVIERIDRVLVENNAAQET